MTPWLDRYLSRFLERRRLARMKRDRRCNCDCTPCEDADCSNPECKCRTPEDFNHRMWGGPVPLHCEDTEQECFSSGSWKVRS